MKISVINASPKTRNSITLQHIKYLESCFGDIEFQIVDVAAKISLFEKDLSRLDELCRSIKACDAVVFSFPVYYALVPSQLKRLIELLYEHKGLDFFKDQYATSFTTSINFFDHTAHNYMQAVCEDLGFRYLDSYSAHMDDFFHEDQRMKMERFFAWFTQMVTRNVPVPSKYAPVKTWPQPFLWDAKDISPAAAGAQPFKNKKILVLTDATGPDSNLTAMVKVFQKQIPVSVTVKNIRDIDMKNGCLGCCTCGWDNTCVQKDGFVRFFNENLKPADIIIIAGTIHDHYLSAAWKQFFDRSFFNGHAPVLKGKQLGYMVSGPLSQVQNLRELLYAMAQTWQMNLTGVVTDEAETAKAVVAQINGFVERLAISIENQVAFAPGFYSVGGKKLFRDFVYNTSAVFRADHLFYKKWGTYEDFPQRKMKKRLNNFIFSLMMRIKPLRKQIHRRFIPEMVAPYKKKLARLKG